MDSYYDDSALDLDDDGLDNTYEWTWQQYINLTSSDSDGDGIEDGYEYYSPLLDPMNTEDGIAYGEKNHNVILTFVRALEHIARLTNYDRLRDKALADCMEELKSILVPSPEEIVLKHEIEGMRAWLQEHGALPDPDPTSALVLLGRSIEFSDRWVVWSSARGQTSRDPPFQAPGYIYLLGYGLGFTSEQSRKLAEHENGNLVGGIAYLLKDAEDYTYEGKNLPYHMAVLVYAARDEILPEWGSYTPTTETVELPVGENTWSISSKEYSYTGYEIEDKWLDCYDVWHAWGDDNRRVGEAGGSAYMFGHITVREVALDVVQDGLQAFEALRDLRHLLQKFIDTDPVI